MCDLSLDPVSLSDMTLEEGPLSGGDEPEALAATIPVTAAVAAAVAAATAVASIPGCGGGGVVSAGGSSAAGEGDGGVSSDTPGSYVTDATSEVPSLSHLHTITHNINPYVIAFALSWNINKVWLSSSLAFLATEGDRLVQN